MGWLGTIGDRERGRNGIVRRRRQHRVNAASTFRRDLAMVTKGADGAVSGALQQR